MADVDQREIESDYVNRRITLIHQTSEQGCGNVYVNGDGNSLEDRSYFNPKSIIQISK